MPLTFVIKTYGCKVNQYEAQVLREGFLSIGFKERCNVPADICIVNGCAVTDRAYKKAGKALRKFSGQCKLLVFTGCSASAYLDREMKWPFDVIIHQGQKDLLISRVCEIMGLSYSHTLPNSISFFNAHHRAFVKVQDGCDVMCSYCYIPYLRSARITVRSFKDITNELKKLKDAGYKEIVFTGISLGRTPFLHKLLYIAQQIGFKRIRLSSIEAKDVTLQLLTTMNELPSVCRHLHIPVQSGSDSVLQRMNRPYTSDKYKAIFDLCREKVTDIAITTDVMIGFPMESEEEFNQTLELLDYIRPMRVHAFPYSIRPKTAAAITFGRDVQVNESIKKARIKKLLLKAGSWTREYLIRFIGREIDVLLEKRVENLGFIGTSEFYFNVLIAKNFMKLGEVYRVKITGNDLKGEDIYLIGRELEIK